jgi:hypothetical protein
MLNPRRQQNAVAKEHYCILRKPAAHDYQHLNLPLAEQNRQLALDSARFEHRVTDMRRFGIQAVIIERYEEITDLLSMLQRRVSTRSVLISGAAHDYEPLGQDRVEGLAEDLGRRLIEEGFDIVSGVGKGIGSAVMIGAHKALARPDATRLRQRLKLFPFPYWHAKEDEKRAYHESNRREMAAQAGVTIFIAGNKLAEGVVIDSPGVFAELSEARKNQHVLIPIGATGHAAKRIWEDVAADPQQFFPGLDARDELRVLGDQNSSNSDLVDSCLALLNKVRTLPV